MHHSQRTFSKFAQKRVSPDSTANGSRGHPSMLDLSLSLIQAYQAWYFSSLIVFSLCLYTTQITLGSRAPPGHATEKRTALPDFYLNFCSVLQPSSIRGLAMNAPWTQAYFLRLFLSFVILTDSSTGSPVHVLMLSIRAVRGLSVYLSKHSIRL